MAMQGLKTKELAFIDCTAAGYQNRDGCGVGFPIYSMERFISFEKAVNWLHEWGGLEKNAEYIHIFAQFKIVDYQKNCHTHSVKWKTLFHRNEKKS